MTIRYFKKIKNRVEKRGYPLRWRTPYILCFAGFLPRMFRACCGNASQVDTHVEKLEWLTESVSINTEYDKDVDVGIVGGSIT